MEKINKLIAKYENCKKIKDDIYEKQNPYGPYEDKIEMICKQIVSDLKSLNEAIVRKPDTKCKHCGGDLDLHDMFCKER